MRRDIVVLGGSAGGVEALKAIVSELPPNVDAAFFIVCHRSPEGPGLLHRVLRGPTSLPVDMATDNAPIVSRRIYVAPPDRHLVLEPEKMRVVNGAKHNRLRPAIDPLFRTAAESHGPRVIGVLLSGVLDDGVAGLLAIKRQQGVAVVQDPSDAAFPNLPRNALATLAVDYCVKLDEIASLISRVTTEPALRERISLPGALHVEADADAGKLEHVERIGKSSPYDCPDCGGVLWQVDDPELSRFRCRVGHAFSMEGLERYKDEQTENALWAALRALRESADVSRRLLDDHRGRNVRFAVDELERRIARNESHAEQIEMLLTNRAMMGPAKTEPR